MTEIKIIIEPNKQGHLVLKKGWPSMFRAYLHDEERYRKCFRGEWYITGDLVKEMKTVITGLLEEPMILSRLPVTWWGLLKWRVF